MVLLNSESSLNCSFKKIRCAMACLFFVLPQHINHHLQNTAYDTIYFVLEIFRNMLQYRQQGGKQMNDLEFTGKIIQQARERMVLSRIHLADDFVSQLFILKKSSLISQQVL